MSGVRHFYRERTSALVRGTNAFVFPTTTAVKAWQVLALTDRNKYHTRVLEELGSAPLDGFTNSSARVGGFVTLGSSPPLSSLPPPGRSFWSFDTPATLRLLENTFSVPAAWAMSTTANLPFGTPNLFSLLPYVSGVECSPAAASNSPAFERAFFDVGNGLGSALGLPRSDQYPFNDLLLRPPNLQESIMATGNGTKSVLFPFEVARLVPFLINWR